MLKWRISRTVDLTNAEMQTERLKALATLSSRFAHEICVRVQEGGKDIDLTGFKVALSIILPDQSSFSEAVKNAVHENRVTVVLPNLCYGREGDVKGVLHLTDDLGGMLPLYAFVLHVGADLTDTLRDPGDVIPSVAELLAQIQTMREVTQSAKEAAKSAAEAANKAFEQADGAGTAAGEANTAAKKAGEAAGAANAAAGQANEAAGAANTAAGTANTAAVEANKAAGAVNAAIEKANTAAGEASTAAGEARQAVADIQGAKTDAEQAVQDANAAVEIAGAWSGAAATAETIPHGQPPTVSVTDGPEGKELHFQVPEGKPGAKASFDDNVISGEKGWSSQQIVKYGVEHYFTPFDAKGSIVQGKLVPSYPLRVTSYIEPIQAGSGTPSPTNIRAISGLNKAILMVFGSNILRIRAHSTTKNGLTYTVKADGSIRVTGTASKREPFYFNTGCIPISGNIVYAYGLPEGGDIADVYIEGNVTMTDGSTQYPQILSAPSVWGNTKSIDKINDVYIIVNAGKTVDVTFRPMLKLSNESNEFEQSDEEVIEQSLSVAAGGNAIYGGEYNWNTGLFKQKYLMIEKKVSEMDDSRQDYPGWILMDNKLRTVLGKNQNLNVNNAISNVATIIGANTSMTYDVIWLSRSDTNADMTVAQWKQKYPDLTVQILIPYADNIRPTIQLNAYELSPRKTGVTTAYGNTDTIAVFGRLDPSAEKASADRRIKSLEEENQMLKGCVMELSEIVYA